MVLFFKLLKMFVLFCFARPQCSFMGMVISHDMLLGRWRLSLELFGRVFMEDVGAEPGSVCIFWVKNNSSCNSVLKLIIHGLIFVCLF